MATCSQTWKAIKDTYEKATGKAKPSASSKGLMSKPSGIEPACKAVDDALGAKVDASLADKTAKAGDALLAKADAYTKQLAKAASTEADPVTKNALKAMETAIEKMVNDARGALNAHADKTWEGFFNNQAPTTFDSKWLVDRLPLQGFQPERKLIVALDMCKNQFVANPYVFANEKRKFANFHRQVDAAINGTVAELTKAIQSAKDPRQAPLRQALTGYLHLLQPIKVQNQKEIDELVKKAKTDPELANGMRDMAMIK